MSQTLLEVENLKKHFPIKRGLFSKTVGKVYAVDGISLRIHRKQTLGVGRRERLRKNNGRQNHPEAP